jgi:hypothetical protein
MAFPPNATSTAAIGNGRLRRSETSLKRLKCVYGPAQKRENSERGHARRTSVEEPFLVRGQHIKLVTPPYVTVGQAQFRMAADQTKRLGYRGHSLARAPNGLPALRHPLRGFGRALRSMCRAQLSDREPAGAKVCRTSHRRNNPRRARRGSDHVRDRSTRLCEDVLCGHRRFDP